MEATTQLVNVKELEKEVTIFMQIYHQIRDASQISSLQSLVGRIFNHSNICPKNDYVPSLCFVT